MLRLNFTYNFTNFCDYLKHFYYVSIANISIFHIDLNKKQDDCFKQMQECYEAFDKNCLELNQKVMDYQKYLTSVRLRLNILLCFNLESII